MKFFIGNNLLTSKEIKETQTGGIQMYLIGNMYAGKKGEEILEKSIVLTAFANSTIAQKISAWYNNDKHPVAVNVAGSISSIGLYNGKPVIKVNILYIEPCHGLSDSMIQVFVTNACIGKDLWRNEAGTFARTNATINFWDGQQEKPCWVDLKFMGQSICTLASKLKIQKGSMINIIGSLSELGIKDVKGTTYLDLSIDVDRIKRVSTQPKQDIVAQSQIVETEEETIPTTDKEDKEAEYPQNSFADICKQENNETKKIYETEDVASFLASLGL